MAPACANGRRNWNSKTKPDNGCTNPCDLCTSCIQHPNNSNSIQRGNQNINTEPNYQYTNPCDLFTCMRHPNTPIQLRVVSWSASYCLLLVEQSFDLSSSLFVTLFIACDVCLCNQCTSLVPPSKTRTGVGYIDTGWKVSASKTTHMYKETYKHELRCLFSSMPYPPSSMMDACPAALMEGQPIRWTHGRTNKCSISTAEDPPNRHQALAFVPSIHRKGYRCQLLSSHILIFRIYLVFYLYLVYFGRCQPPEAAHRCHVELWYESMQS